LHEPQREGVLSVNRTRRYDAAIIGAGQGEKPLAMVTEDGTIAEAMRIVDVKDGAEPVRLRIREWIDERHHRDVEVAEGFWALGPPTLPADTCVGETTV
jgi:hypothetical protein